MSEYDTANEHELCFQIGKLKRRIAELSRALGLITTLKPTMVMDADHPLDMAKEVVEYMTTIIANTQQANRGLCANYIYELNENIKLTARIAKLEAENERLKEDLQHEKTRSRLNLEAEKRRMLNITYYCAEIDRLNARIAELEAENVGLKERVAMLDVTAVFKSLGEMGYIEQTNKLHTRIAELEGLVDELIEAGESMSLAVECENQIEANAYYSWKELVKDWKEREE